MTNSPALEEGYSQEPKGSDRGTSSSCVPRSSRNPVTWLDHYRGTNHAEGIR